MRALVWLIEDTWRATVDDAASLVPANAEIILLHVADAEVEGVVRGARAGLLGRARRPGPERRVPILSEQASRDLLSEARARLGRPAELLAARGRVEREVLAGAQDADLLVMARDGDRGHLGPRSLGPQARFILDHAPCRVLLIWPDQPPDVSTIPPLPGSELDHQRR